MDQNGESITLPEGASEMDRKAMAWIARMEEIRVLSDAVLLRWRNGEMLADEVQRRIFNAAFKLEQVCRALEREFGKRQAEGPRAQS